MSLPCRSAANIQHEIGHWQDVAGLGSFSGITESSMWMAKFLVSHLCVLLQEWLCKI